LAPWIDHEQIVAGDDILDKIGEGLTTMDILIFLVSKESLESVWVDLEVKHAAWREIEERRVLILLFRISDISIEKLPWFLRRRYAPSVTADSEGASMIANDARKALERRIPPHLFEPLEEIKFEKNPRVDELLEKVSLGDWSSSQEAALKMNMLTTKNGYNELFKPLLSYLESPDDDQRWGAIQTLESFADLAPWLYDIELLSRLGNHEDFSIRSMVAVICYNLALFAPHLVPINLLVKLSSHDEDWYVSTPAIGALKTLARWRPTILKIFLIRLRNANPFSRELAAQAIYDISEKEPEILNLDDLKNEIKRLGEINDRIALDLITKAISKAKEARFGSQYKYSAF
jgi:hypothetical protein